MVELTSIIINAVGGDSTARTLLNTAVERRVESYIQADEPVTAAPALWFDTSEGFLTLKIQR